MARRSKTTREDYYLDKLTQLFCWLVAAAAISGLLGQIAR
jgi:hypothetical protein